LLRLRATAYVQQKEKPKGLTEIFSAEFTAGGEKKGWIKLYEGIPHDAPPTATDAAKKHYAVSARTRGNHVEVLKSGAAALNSELKDVLRD